MQRIYLHKLDEKVEKNRAIVSTFCVTQCVIDARGISGQLYVTITTIVYLLSWLPEAQNISEVFRFLNSLECR